MKWICFALLLIGVNTTRAQKVINVTDYGISPNSFEDAVPALKKAIAECEGEDSVVLSFPQGRYDFWPAEAEVREYYISNTSSEKECPSKLKKIALLFENKNNVTIEGNGSQFIFHGKLITWTFDKCSNIRLQNLSVDFERPTMSELTIESVSDAEITAHIHPDSKYEIINNKIIFYGEGWSMQKKHTILVQPSQGTMHYSSFEPFSNSVAVQAGPDKVIFRGEFSTLQLSPGDVLTIRDPVRDHVGAFINRSQNVVLKNVTMHYMHGLGIVSQFSENLFFDSVQVKPSRGRQIAAFADGMHFSGCKGKIFIENSSFKGLHDDPVNVHGTHLQVSTLTAPDRLRVKFMHPQTYGFEAFMAGDSIAFVQSATLRSYGTGNVKAAQLISEKEMELELEEAAPATLKPGDVLENISWNPELTVRNCRFEGTNTRGLLVTTRKKVLIENNVFYRTGMHAILIANDASSWYESGPVMDVTIRNNRFEECGYNSGRVNSVINIAPENHTLVDNEYVHQNIRIENNHFKIFDQPVLSARSTQNLFFNHNHIQRSTFLPSNPSAYKPGFVFNACDNVTIIRNKFTGVKNQAIKLSNMNKNSIKME